MIVAAAARDAHSNNLHSSSLNQLKFVTPEWLKFDLRSLCTVRVVIWFWPLNLMFLPCVMDFRMPSINSARLLHGLPAPCVIVVRA